MIFLQVAILTQLKAKITPNPQANVIPKYTTPEVCKRG